MDLTVLLNDPAARRILHERARSLAKREHTTDTIAEELFVYFDSVPNATVFLPLLPVKSCVLPASRHYPLYHRRSWGW